MPSPQNDAQRMRESLGSITRSVAPANSSDVPLRKVHVVPPFVDSQTPYFCELGGVVRRMPPRPRSVAMYRWLGLPGSTTMSDVELPMKKSPETCVHVLPASADR